MLTEEELSKIKQALTSIRTESATDDVWNKFVVPRFYNESEIKSHHSLRIEGSRGSGKTMLLKYLSYKSQFSKSREFIPESTIEYTGIYWKADPQFLRMLCKRSICEEKWASIFDNYVLLKVAIEMINSIYEIAHSKCDAFAIVDVNSFSIEGIKDYGFNNENINDVFVEFESSLRKIEMSIMNTKKIESLVLLPSTFLKFLVEELKKINGKLSFYVYIDEYENLLMYQQRIINTKIKISENSIKFNIAIKKNGMSEYGTCGNENLENVADYRILNLDEKIKNNSLEEYLAEILIKKIADSSTFMRENLGLDISLLNNPDEIGSRENIEYLRMLKDTVKNILPERSSEDLAVEVFENKKFLDKLKNNISASNTNSEFFQEEIFIDPKYKKASIVCSSLLNRKNIKKEDIYKEFEKLKSGEENKFTGRTDWVKNNFIGSYLRIINSYSSNSTFYSGFSVFCLLSSGNIRHFLELCRTSFSFLKVSDIENGFVVSNRVQDLAARQTSETLVREIKQFTPYGAQLLRLVEGLGTLFNHYQQSLAQSEPEVTQFGFDNSSVMNDKDSEILKAAEKWGVLYIQDSTKEKNYFETGISEYILSPIYSPKFSISYRKGRKKILNFHEFGLLYNEGKSGAEKIIKSENKDNTDDQGHLIW